MELGSAFAPAAAEVSLGHARQDAAPFDHVAVHGRASAAEAAWAYLENVAPISGYQTRHWLIPWIETVGRHSGAEPLLIVASKGDGEPVAMLPLGLVRRGGCTRACFLGKRDVNFNLGLFAPGVSWSRRDLQSLLRQAAKSSAGRIDFYDLQNQPEAWCGIANPMAFLPRQPSPSFSAFGRLLPDPEAFFAARGSHDTRKTLGKKARRLAKNFGPLQHVVARDPACAQLILDAFYTQKTRRLLASGLPDLFGDPSLMDFLRRSTTEGLPNAAVELHALYSGERIVATFGGVGHHRRFSGMFISFDDDIDVARSSPGDQLLRKVVAAKCTEGYQVFDLGVGEALYKTGYCDEIEPLFDTTFGITPMGHAWALIYRQSRRLKRTIKQTPWLWALACRVRQVRRHMRR